MASPDPAEHPLPVAGGYADPAGDAPFHPGAGRINLFVTHDTILSTFVYELADRHPLSREDWPWMMEGIFLWFDARHVHWLWRGEAGHKDLADYQIG
jgi:hypothetical protein